MSWTWPTAVFFVAVALMLAAMAAWEVRSPSSARRGFLPLVTTRGDRLFIGLMAAAWLHLAWIGLTSLPAWIASLLSLALLLALGRWG